MTALSQIPFDSFDAAVNMAIDSLMLAGAGESGEASWRFYGWREPAVTFGYSQKWEWVRHRVPPGTKRMIRRLTGGGLVDHRQDLTYALALPPTHPVHRWKAPDFYRELHQGLAGILQQAGTPCRLMPCGQACDQTGSQTAGVCFEAAEPFDIVDPSTGLKLAGAAMKRSREGLLVQGSLDRRNLAPESLKVLRISFGTFLSHWLEIPEGEPAPLPLQETIEPRAREFASPEWNRKR